MDEADVKKYLDEIFKVFEPAPAPHRSLQEIDADYRAFVQKTNLHGKHEDVAGEILELAAEAGEVLGLLTKAERKGVAIQPDALLDELSDVVWGVYAVLTKMNWSLAEVITFNKNKLTARLEAGHLSSPQHSENL